MASCKGGGIIYLEGGIGIMADPGENSYDPPLMTFSKPVKIPMTPPQIVFMNMIKGICTMFIACVYYK